jgi:hypothetical protein
MSIGAGITLIAVGAIVHLVGVVLILVGDPVRWPVQPPVPSHSPRGVIGCCDEPFVDRLFPPRNAGLAERWGSHLRNGNTTEQLAWRAGPPAATSAPSPGLGGCLAGNGPT